MSLAERIGDDPGWPRCRYAGGSLSSLGLAWTGVLAGQDELQPRLGSQDDHNLRETFNSN